MSPESRERRRAYLSAYRARPENKARQREAQRKYQAKPKIKVRRCVLARRRRSRERVARFAQNMTADGFWSFIAGLKQETARLRCDRLLTVAENRRRQEAAP